MHTLLITLVGPQRNVDLQVPGEVPISELMPAFVKLCGPRLLDARLADPTGWSISRKEYPAPLDQNLSLLDVGIVNGTTLVLHEKASLQRTEQSSTRPLVQFSRQPAVTPTTTFHVPVRDYPPRLPGEEIVISAPPPASAQAGRCSSVATAFIAPRWLYGWIALLPDVFYERNGWLQRPLDDPDRYRCAPALHHCLTGNEFGTEMDGEEAAQIRARNLPGISHSLAHTPA